MDPLGLRLTPGERAAVATISAIAGFVGSIVAPGPLGGAAAAGLTGFVLSLALGGDFVDVANSTLTGIITGASGGLFGELVVAAGARAVGTQVFSFLIDLAAYGGQPLLQNKIPTPCY